MFYYLIITLGGGLPGVERRIMRIQWEGTRRNHAQDQLFIRVVHVARDKTPGT